MAIVSAVQRPVRSLLRIATAVSVSRAVTAPVTAGARQSSLLVVAAVQRDLAAAAEGERAAGPGAVLDSVADLP
ncbi:hypothetical protein [Lentzea sp. NPDC055074]